MYFSSNPVSRREILAFYDYYREFMEREHTCIHSRMDDLIAKLSEEARNKGEQITCPHRENSGKIEKNMELIKFIKGGYLISNTAIQLTERQEVVDLITKDLTDMKSFLYKKWMELAQFVTNNSKWIARLYQKEYQALSKERFKGNVFSHRIKNHDWRTCKYSDSGKINLEQAFSEKKKVISSEELWKEHFPIENVSYFGKSDKNVKIFEEIYEIRADNQSFRKKVRHVIVLVHGFQASRQDFILLKNCL